MTTRNKTLIVIGLAFVTLFALLSATASWLVTQGYWQLEQRGVQDDVARLVNAITYDIADLNSTADDYAAWDDTYQFMADGNAAYIQSYLAPESSNFTTLRVNAILLAGADGRFVYTGTYGLAPLPPGWQEQLAAQSWLRDSSVESGTSGILMLSGTPALVAIRPILTNEHTGPARGRLFVLRYLDANEIGHLSDLTRLSISTQTLDDPGLREDLPALLGQSHESAPPIVQPLDEDRIAGLALLRDINDAPALALRVTTTRDIYLQGRNSLAYLLVSLMVIGITFVIITVLILEKLVLTRLSILSSTVDGITARNDFAAQLVAEGRDEFAKLGRAINALLTALSKTYADLEERVRSRTRELMLSNATLQHEVGERQRAEEKLQRLLDRTREMYGISQRISGAHTSEDVLRILLDASDLQPAAGACIIIFDRPGRGAEPPSAEGEVVTAYGRHTLPPGITGTRYTYVRQGSRSIGSDSEPVYIDDVTIEPSLAPTLRDLALRNHAHSLVSFALVANARWYGALLVYFERSGAMSGQDLQHIRRLADQAAMAIYNIRLFEAEAAARRAAELANELKLKFLAIISHELRTPLTSIKGFATTLLADDITWDAASQREFIQIIDQESDRLTALIEQLLDLSRLQAGTLRIHPEVDTVRAIVETAAAQLATISVAHPLHVAIPDNLPALRADRERIAQVITNLVDNAAKYTPRGSPITLTASLDGDRVRFDVSDQGVGIPVTDREIVFEAFHRGENDVARRTKGAGLGLAICKGLIEAHGGCIWIQEKAEPGTTVSFTLPLA